MLPQEVLESLVGKLLKSSIGLVGDRFNGLPRFVVELNTLAGHGYLSPSPRSLDLVVGGAGGVDDAAAGARTGEPREPRPAVEAAPPPSPTASLRRLLGRTRGLSS
jgi:hypothetical protein